MPFAVVGLSHRTAPIEIRERFMFARSELAQALTRLIGHRAVREATLLSTCNRTEVYMHLAEQEEGSAEAVRILAEHAGELPRQAESYMYVHRGIDVVRHLYRVTSGMDSMVLGEVQIQGQVRDAYELARGLTGDRRAVQAVFNRLFQTALSVGGRVKTETQLSEGAASVPSAAVELARKIFGSLRGRSGMILGAGDMGELALRTLIDEGMSEVFVASRRLSRSEELTREVGGSAVPYEDFRENLGLIDVLITSTSAPVALIKQEDLQRARSTVRKKPLLIVDISIPRDVDPAVGKLRNVFLYSIDDLEHIVSESFERRRGELPLAEEIVGEAADAFWRWRSGLQAVPLIKELRERAEEVRRIEFDKAIRRFDGLSESDKERIERLTKSMLQKLLHEPTSRLRTAAENGQDLDVLAAMQYLLETGDDDKDEDA